MRGRERGSAPALALRLAALLSVTAPGCGPRPDAGPPAGGDTSGRGEGAAGPAAERPVTVTLRRDSLGLADGAPLDTVRAAMERALPRLRSAAEFDVLALSPAVRALQLRPVGPGGSAALAEALRAHPLVEAAEVEGVARVQPP